MADEESQIPEEFKQASWLSNQIVKYPLRTIFIMLIFVISTMSSVTIFFYNRAETERKEQLIDAKERWAKQEAEVTEYKEYWIKCMQDKLEKTIKMDSITGTNKKSKKKTTK